MQFGWPDEDGVINNFRFEFYTPYKGEAYYNFKEEYKYWSYSGPVDKLHKFLFGAYPWMPNKRKQRKSFDKFKEDFENLFKENSLRFILC